MDSDGDGILDSLNNNFASKTEFDDPNPLKYEYLWEWPVIYSNGIKCANLQSSFVETVGRNPIHKAIDISTGEIGTPVVSSTTGIVTYTSKEYRDWCNDCSGPYNKCSCNGSYGNYIDVMSTINGRTFLIRYAHLSVINVKSGTKVNAGDRIGDVGSTGGSNGYHLDFSVSEIVLGQDYGTKATIQGNVGLKITPDSFVDSILFDNFMIVNKINQTYEVRKYEYNMLMNIPRKISNVCGRGSSCIACSEYFISIQEKYLNG